MGVSNTHTQRERRLRYVLSDAREVPPLALTPYASLHSLFIGLNRLPALTVRPLYFLILLPLGENPVSSVGS